MYKETTVIYVIRKTVYQKKYVDCKTCSKCWEFNWRIDNHSGFDLSLTNKYICNKMEVTLNIDLIQLSN